MNINPDRVVEAVRAIPPGKVTTYQLLARALGADPSSRNAIDLALQPFCRETVWALLLNKAGGEDLVPCWRVVEQSSNGKFRPAVDITGEVDQATYRMAIQPLLDDGVPISPPDYWIAPEYVYQPSPLSPN